MTLIISISDESIDMASLSLQIKVNWLVIAITKKYGNKFINDVSAEYQNIDIVIPLSPGEMAQTPNSFVLTSIRVSNESRKVFVTSMFVLYRMLQINCSFKCENNFFFNFIRPNYSTSCAYETHTLIISAVALTDHEFRAYIFEL